MPGGMSGSSAGSRRVIGEPFTNFDFVKGMTVKELAEYGVGEIPASWVPPMWTGHFDGWRPTREEAVIAEVNWLFEPAPDNDDTRRKRQKAIDGDCISRATLLQYIDCGFLRSPTELCWSDCSVAEMIRAAPAVSPPLVSDEPLTLDELYSVDKEPLFFTCTVGRWRLNGWHIVEAVSRPGVPFKDLRLDYNENCICDTYNYGITWTAYRIPRR